MKTYYGTKKLAAKPMTRGQYNAYRGWQLPENESADDAGYLVEYLDGGKPNDDRHQGYISWSPAEQFEKAYQPTDGLSFGHAVVAIKEGKKVARSGWNGKGMFLYYVPEFPKENTSFVAFNGFYGRFDAFIAMKTAQDTVVPWLASQTDVLADDWQIVD